VKKLPEMLDDRFSMAALALYCIIAAGVILISTITSHAATLENTIPYELQSRCGNDAAVFFKRHLEQGRSNDAAFEHRPTQDYATYNYENNYSPTMGGCFIVIKNAESIPGGSLYGACLYNVATHRELGHFGVMKKDLVSCEFNGAQCSSESEWQRLAKPYLHN
jgi:hypothetical protein